MKQSKPKLIISVLAAVIVLAASLAAAYIYFGPNGSVSDTKPDHQTSTDQSSTQESLTDKANRLSHEAEESAAAGEVEAAIDKYRQLEKTYQDENDPASAATIRQTIDSLESRRAPAGESRVDPRLDAGGEQPAS